MKDGRFVVLKSLVLVQLAVGAAAQSCAFPAAWQSLWFTHYDDKAGVLWVYAIGPSSVIEYTGHSAVEQVYRCNNSYRPTNDVLYYVISLSGTSYCQQTAVVGNAMIVKQTVLTDEERSVAASECPVTGRGRALVSWYIRYPYSVKGEQCPFARGRYQAVYWERLSEPLCEGDPLSEVVISDNTITIKTCYNGTTSYSRPLHHTTLTCVGDGGRSFLGNDGHSALFLLAEFAKIGNSRFYCGRYRMSNYVVEFALAVHDPHLASCDDVTSYNTAVQGRVTAFKLTDTESLSSESPSSEAPSITASSVPPSVNITTVTMTTSSESIKGNNSCEFPRTWWGLYWFGYFLVFDHYQEVLQEYSSDKMSSTISGNPFQMFSCISLTIDAPSTYFIRFWIDDPSVRHCVRIKDYVTGVLLYQQQALGADQFTRAEECKTVFSNADSYRVQVKKPPPSTACPLSGKYHVTVNGNASLSDECIGNYSSISHVFGSVMVIRSCRDVDKYSEPFYSDLTCVATWRAGYLDELHGDEYGDYLLLSYVDVNSLVRYICARYQLTDTGMTMSLYIKDNNTASCLTSSSHLTVGADYSHVTFTDYASLPKLSSSATSPTTTTSSTGTTTTTSPTTVTTSAAAATTTATVTTTRARTTAATTTVPSLTEVAESPATTMTPTTSQRVRSTEIRYTSSSKHRTLSNKHRTLISTHRTHSTRHGTLSTSRGTLSTRRGTPSTRPFKPTTRHPALSTRLLIPITRSPTTSTTPPMQSSKNPTFSTRKPTPSSRPATVVTSLLPTTPKPATSQLTVKLTSANWFSSTTRQPRLTTIPATTPREVVNTSTSIVASNPTKTTETLLSVTMTTSQNTTLAGVCIYPAKWRYGYWWYGYQEILGGIYPQTERYLESYLMTQIELEGETSSLHYTCKDFMRSGPSEYYVKYLTNQSTIMACVQVISEIPGVLLTREFLIAATHQDAVTVSDCLHEMPAEASYRVHIQKPFNFTLSVCPLLPGSYHTTVSINETSKDNCQHNTTSVTMVTTNKMTVKSCLGTSIYGSPYNAQFTCVALWSGGLLDEELGGIGGDYLLLAYKDADNLTKFICARYQLMADGIKMSLNVYDTHSAECTTVKTYAQFGEHFQYFELKRKMLTVPEETTTTSSREVTTKKTTTASSSITLSTPSVMIPSSSTTSTVTKKLGITTTTTASTVTFTSTTTRTTKTTTPVTVTTATTTTAGASMDNVVITTATRATVFPSRLADTRWLIGYKTTSGGPLPLTVQYTDNEVIYYEDNRENATLMIEDLKMATNVIYYVTYISGTVSSRQCVQLLQTAADILLVRKKDFRVQLSALSCEDQFSQNEPFQVLIKEPTSSVVCPFSEGIFHAVYTSSLGLRYCEGDFNSTITIDKDKLSLQVCTGQEMKSVLSKTDMLCIRMWSVENLESKIVLPDGDYLLLAYADEKGPKFICAHYKVTDNGIELFFHINNESTVECSTKNDQTTYNSNNIEFLLKELDECLSHPCLNSGTCYDLGQGYYCKCQDGIIGDNCEVLIDVEEEGQHDHTVTIILIVVIVAVVIIAAVIICVVYSQMQSQRVVRLVKRGDPKKEGVGHSGAALWYPDYAQTTPGNPAAHREKRH